MLQLLADVEEIDMRQLMRIVEMDVVPYFREHSRHTAVDLARS